MSRTLRRAFLDICNGYSEMPYKGEIIFVKHLSHREHVELEDLEEQYKQNAKSKGLYTEEEKKAFLAKEGLWTIKDENNLIQQESFIARLNDSKKNVTLPSVLERLRQDVEKEQKKLNELRKKRESLIGITCEAYAHKIVNEYYIYKSLYKDKELKYPLFDIKDFDDIEDSELDDIVVCYNQSIEYCSDINIKKLAIQDFFRSYFNLCSEDLSSFFGKAICNFTFFQVKLVNFGLYFKNLLAGVDFKTLPPKCLEDPDYLVEYLDTTKKGKEMIDNTKGQAVSIVGATKQDIDQLAGQGGTKNNAIVGNKPMTMQEIMAAIGSPKN